MSKLPLAGNAEPLECVLGLKSGINLGSKSQGTPSPFWEAQLSSNPTFPGAPGTFWESLSSNPTFPGFPGRCWELVNSNPTFPGAPGMFWELQSPWVGMRTPPGTGELSPVQLLCPLGSSAASKNPRDFPGRCPWLGVLPAARQPGISQRKASLCLEKEGMLALLGWLRMSWICWETGQRIPAAEFLYPTTR